MEPEKLSKLFDQLARDIVNEANLGNAADDHVSKLWQLPKATVHYYYNVVTDQEKSKASPLVEKFRLRAVDLINQLPETKTFKEALSLRLSNAAKQFRFRQWRETDLDVYRSLLDNEEMWRFFPENYPDPLTPDAATALIETSNNLPDRHKVHAIEWNGAVVGQARLLFDPATPDAAEISYWLGQQYWGQGLAGNFVALYTQISFRENPNINRIFAKVIEGNAASVKLLEKVGYRDESFAYKNVEKYGDPLSTQTLSVFRKSYQT